MIGRRDLETALRDAGIEDAAALRKILRLADEYGAGLAGGTASGIKAMEAWEDGRAMRRSRGRAARAEGERAMTGVPKR
jgi:hypothetical protein